MFIANGSWMSDATYHRIATAWTFIGATSDLFITCMIWYILDENASPDVFRQGKFTYAVLDIIKVYDLNNSAKNYDLDKTPNDS